MLKNNKQKSLFKSITWEYSSVFGYSTTHDSKLIIYELNINTVVCRSIKLTKSICTCQKFGRFSEEKNILVIKVAFKIVLNFSIDVLKIIKRAIFLMFKTLDTMMITRTWT